MASEWAEEADRQARAVTRDLTEVGKAKNFRAVYQKREARFMLKAGTVTAYFSAHDYKTKSGGMDWLKLRIDILSFVRNGGQQQEAAAKDEETKTPAPIVEIKDAAAAAGAEEEAAENQ